MWTRHLTSGKKGTYSLDTSRIALIVLCSWFFSCDARVIAPPPGEFDALIAFCVTVGRANGITYSEVWAGEEDGRFKKVSLNPACYNKDPDVSPDGKHVVFCSCELMSSGVNDVFVVDADGNGLRNITNDQSIDESPRWSPDGKRIAFQSVRGGQRDVYVVDSSKGPTRILSESKGSSWLGDWSPDGGSLVYYSFVPDSIGQEWQVVSVSVSGADRKQLTSGPGKKTFPSWSPRCSTIAYLQDQQLYVMSARGQGHRKLETQVDSVTSPPCWAPDGQNIYFEGVRQGRSDIYRISEAGTGLVNLTQVSYPGSNPSVSPDGKEIAYVARLGVQSRVHVMNNDGSGKRQLTQFNVVDEFQPVWRRRHRTDCL